MKPVAIAAALALSLLAGVSAASAAPAFANSTTNIHLGPGTENPITGTMLEGSTLDANCTPQGWCEIYGTGRTNDIAGWVPAGAVTFTDAGIQPAPQPNTPRPPAPGPNVGGGGNPGFSLDFNFGNSIQPPPRPPRPQPLPEPVYEEASACFYTERNFGGTGFCLGEGEEFPRLPRDWNDRIRSVEVLGGASVDLCTDTDFYGSCVTVTSSTSRLPGGIDRRVSSVEVYY